MNTYLKLFTCLLFFIFYTSFCFAQNLWLWGKYGDGRGLGNSVTIDNNGNCFLTGYFYPGSNPGSDSLVFGSYFLYTNVPNSLDAFIAKFDNNGNIQWAKQTTCMGQSNILNGFQSSTDNMGNAYLTATFCNTMKVGPYTLSTPQYYSASYLVKFDPNGNVIWAKQSNVPAGPTNSSVASSYVCTDKNGSSYITGIFGDTAIFDKDTLVYGGDGNVFLVKYDANGNVKWVKAAGSYSSTSGGKGEGDALDKYGNVYLTGEFVDTVYFGADTLRCPYYMYNFFLAKYDTNGNIKWVKQAKMQSVFCYGWGYAVTCDQWGNVYAAGEFEDTLIFDKDTLISSCDTIFNHDLNHTNFFVAKFDSSGNFKWAVQDNTPTTYGTSAWGISSDTMGHIYVCGNVGFVGNCSVNIGKDTILTTKDTSSRDAPAILLKLDTAGNLLCANMFPYAGAEYNSIASDPSGNYVYYGGTLLTEAIFGQDILNPWSPEIGYFPILARWKECEPTLAVDEVRAISEEVRVYPNPSTGQFNIVVSGKEQGISEMQIEIYDITGQKVYQQTIQSEKTEINLGNQPNGMYFYRVLNQNEGFIGSGKILMQH